MSESSGISWLGNASSPIVATTALRASNSGSPGCDERPEGDDQDDQGHGDREQPGLLEVADDRVVELRLGVDAELLDREVRVACGGGDDRLLDRRVEGLGLVGVGRPKLDDDERRMTVGRDLIFVAGRERRPGLLHLRQAVRPSASTSRMAALKAGSSTVRVVLWTITWSPWAA